MNSVRQGNGGQPGARAAPASSFRVDVVIPTHNRSQIVTRKVRWLLDLPEVDRVVVVADGCEDDTAEALVALDAPRVLLVEAPTALGPHGARNLGIRQTQREWIVILDDDDLHPKDFISRLGDVAVESGADLIGAPWLNLQGDALLAEVERRRMNPGKPRLDAVGVFPKQRWIETPWLPNGILVRASLFDVVSFDEGYGGSFYREETDLFVAAARRGFRVVLTPLTYSFGGPRGEGGIDRTRRMRYEFSVISNNWRFLKKHGSWLKMNGLISGAIRVQARFVAARVTYRLGGAARARLMLIRTRLKRASS